MTSSSNQLEEHTENTDVHRKNITVCYANKIFLSCTRVEMQWLSMRRDYE